MSRLSAVLMVALLFSCWPIPCAAASPLANHVVSDELIIRLRPDAALSALAWASGPHALELNAVFRAAGAGAARLLGPHSDTYRVRLRPGANLQHVAQALSAIPDVVYAEPNHLRQGMRLPSDPMITEQWALRNIQALAAWDITTGNNMTIAVLDTGVSASHPDLAGKVLRGYNVFSGSDDAGDDEGHGTYTAGVAAANSDNSTGIAGVCWGCTILPIKVLDRHGHGNDAGIAAGIRWAVDQGVRIISMSLGGPDDTRVLRDAVAYAHDHNTLIIAASGNGQTEGNQPNYPAALPAVLAVAATNANDSVTGFSTTGEFVDIAAPGVGVWSTWWQSGEGDTYGPANGTSAACPFVAGAAALILSVRPDLSADQLAEVLEIGADDQGLAGKDFEEGYGRLNILRSLQLAGDPTLLTHARVQGTITGGQVGQIIVSLDTGQQTQPDAAGFYAFDNLAAGTYLVTISGPGISLAPQHVWLSGTALSVAIVNFNLGQDLSPFFAPVVAPQPGTTFFPATGHTLQGAFKEYWVAHGGLAIFGYPTSEEFIERDSDGRDYRVQYFERHRFELHPENPQPYHVLLSRFGDLVLQQGGRNWFTLPTSEQQSGCMFFAETGHNLCEPFLSYWRAHGLEFDGRRGKSSAESLALFGQPLSDAQPETLSDGQTYIVQWFERARFEDHGAAGVLLGLLANEVTQTRGLRQSSSIGGER